VSPGMAPNRPGGHGTAKPPMQNLAKDNKKQGPDMPVTSRFMLHADSMDTYLPTSHREALTNSPRALETP
jgi:hypothetical protein